MHMGRTVAWRLACSLAALLYWSAVGAVVALATGRDPLDLFGQGAVRIETVGGLLLLAAAVALYAIAARSAHRRATAA